MNQTSINSRSPFQLALQRLVVLAFILLAPVAFAQKDLTASRAKARPIPKDLHLLPTMQPLLQYLRCEADTLNQFGESMPPIEALGPLLDNEGPSSVIPLTVWGRTQAQLFIAAGFGFLVVAQHYPPTERDNLLELMKAAGWKFTRQSMRQQERVGYSIIDDLVAVHTAELPVKGDIKRTRKLTLIEAKVNFLSRDIDMNGLTVICQYSNDNSKAPGR